MIDGYTHPHGESLIFAQCRMSSNSLLLQYITALERGGRPWLGGGNKYGFRDQWGLFTARHCIPPQ